MHFGLEAANAIVKTGGRPIEVLDRAVRFDTPSMLIRRDWSASHDGATRPTEIPGVYE
jgi:hypothetical protein